MYLGQEFLRREKGFNQRFGTKGKSPLGQQLLGLKLIWSIVLETLICASGLESNLLWKTSLRHRKRFGTLYPSL